MARSRFVALLLLLAPALNPATVPATSPAPPPAFAPESVPLHHFVGALHTHTGYSDGWPGSTPMDAYVRARDVENLDFAAVTEHSETFDAPSTLSEYCLPNEGGSIVECALADPDPIKATGKWAAQRVMAADASRPGDFLAMRGFEWSSETHGHMNVYFSRNATSWARDGGAASMSAMYEWLRRPPTLGGGADGLATFNHPDDKTLCRHAPGQTRPALAPVCAADPARNWNDFAYRADMDERVVGIEMFNRSRSYEPFVVRALDKGWHVGVVGAEDIHEDDWGSSRYAKTIVVAAERTPIAFKEAMQRRSFYATLDHGIRISFATSDGRPMGSRVPDHAATLVAHVEGGDVASLDLLTNGAGGPDGNIPTIAASSVGRDLTVSVAASGGERWFMVRVTDSTGRRSAYSSPIWLGSPAQAPFTPRWVAGDLHVHSTWSHDSYGGPHDDSTMADESYTLGWTPGEQIAIAESRGLDYVAITDHNDTRSAFDPDFTSDRLTLVPAYENSLAGHVQMLGTSECVSPSGPDGRTQGCNAIPNRNAPATVAALRDALRAAGGAFQINHPSDRNWVDTFGDGSASTPLVPDSVEVWNVGPWIWQPPAPSSNDNDDALAFWQTYLNAGAPVAATGGSDNHWRSTTAVQGVGQPTTWVYVTEPGWRGIVNGIRAGRTSISSQPPALGGARLDLMADGDGDGIAETLPGGTVPAGGVIHLRSESATPGSRYRIVTDDGITVVEPHGTRTVVPIPTGARWIRAELFVPDAQEERRASCDGVFGSSTTLCRNRLIMSALTSAVYVS